PSVMTLTSTSYHRLPTVIFRSSMVWPPTSCELSGCRRDGFFTGTAPHSTQSDPELTLNGWPLAGAPALEPIVTGTPSLEPSKVMEQALSVRRASASMNLE